MSTPKEIKARIEFREQLDAILELLTELFDNADPDHIDRGLFSVATEMQRYYPEEVKQPESKFRPMDNLEARQFEKTVIPYGKYKGELVGNVPLPYLRWLSGAPEQFKEDCRRYIANPEIERMLES